MLFPINVWLWDKRLPKRMCCLFLVTMLINRAKEVLGLLVGLKLCCKVRAVLSIKYVILDTMNLNYKLVAKDRVCAAWTTHVRQTLVSVLKRKTSGDPNC